MHHCLVQTRPPMRSVVAALGPSSCWPCPGPGVRRSAPPLPSEPHRRPGLRRSSEVAQAEGRDLKMIV